MSHGLSHDILRSDRLELVLTGSYHNNYHQDTMQPYVMRNIQIFARFVTVCCIKLNHLKICTVVAQENSIMADHI